MILSSLVTIATFFIIKKTIALLFLQELSRVCKFIQIHRHRKFCVKFRNLFFEQKYHLYKYKYLVEILKKNSRLINFNSYPCFETIPFFFALFFFLHIFIIQFRIIFQFIHSSLIKQTLESC